MTWQPIDFQRIVALDKTLVIQLEKYLQEKEAELGNALIHAVPHPSGGTFSLPPPRNSTLKLSDAVEGLGKKLRQISESKEDLFPKDTWKEIALNISQSFWEYEEVLEGCVKELFQQLDQLDIAQWNKDLTQVLDSIKDILIHSIEDLSWAFKRIESQIREFKLSQDLKNGKILFFKKLFNSWRPTLDQSLIKNLIQTEKYLKIHHKKYRHQLAEYMTLDDKVHSIMKKLDHFEILQNLDDDTKKKYKTLYYYVKLWKLNQRNKSIPVLELTRALVFEMNAEQTAVILRKYCEGIKAALFHQSRVIKKKTIRYLKDEEGKKAIFDLIKGYRSELSTLGSTIVAYRDFLLRTDPNPYIRSRWGFTDWVVGPEPEQTKHLLNIEYEVESLEALFERLEEAIERAGEKQSGRRLRLSHNIQRLLHEMGQPLTSYNMTKTRAEHILEHLNNVDELGSLNAHSVDYAGKLFSKLLRADWKHHVVHELPLFHELFKIHMGIMGGSNDRNHLNRMNKFRHLIQEIEMWVKNRQTRKHEHDIELDMNDLKGYLQDFLAQVQRTSKDETLTSESAPSLISELAHQLLIYRFMFGEFFYFLGRYSIDGKRIRNKLLFVDQYFESVENKLHILRNMTFPKKEEEVKE